MDKRSGFWQVDLTAAAQELLAFITPKGRAFKWKVMPFGVAHAPALFQELMNKILYILRRRPLLQEVIPRGAEMEARIDWSNRGGMKHNISPRTGSSGGEPGATDWSVRGSGENMTKEPPGFEQPGRNEARR